MIKTWKSVFNNFNMKYLLLLFLPGVFFGQELHHQVISSQGNTSQLSDGMIVRATVGQSITGNSGQKDYIVQQGFQQSYWSSYISQNDQSTKAVTVVTFPNPFIDLVNFRFSDEIGSEVDISIFDVAGRMIVFQKINVIDNQISIDLRNLAKAEYLVRLTSGSLKYYTKIIKKTL